MTVVGPFPESPARRIADFTCALATGDRQVNPSSTRRPWTRSGAVPSGDAAIAAPIARSGSTTRSIGRLRNEASPSRVASHSLPASTPASRRMVVPELPQSSTLSGLRMLTPTPAPSSA